MEMGVGAKVADKVVDLEEVTGEKKGGRRMLLLSVNLVLCLWGQGLTVSLKWIFLTLSPCNNPQDLKEVINMNMVQII